VSRFANRLDYIEPFHVMALLAKARELEAEGKSIIHMEIGEPDFPTAEGIVQAGIQALAAGHTKYTPALGLPELRQAIAENYPPTNRPLASQVVITPGASGALQLVCSTVINPGNEVIMGDPGYPCNRHFVRLFEGKPVLIPVNEAGAYQLTAEQVAAHWTASTVAVLLASPSNPSGTLITEQELKKIAAVVKAHDGVLVVDEIYHGLTYENATAGKPASALSLDCDVFVVNSFSKYYGMTGWRLGWLLAPEKYISAIDRLAQNFFLATSTIAQYAALAAFSEGVQQQLAQRRDIFQQRRDYLYPALKELGFNVAVKPEGAFYIYCDASNFTHNSDQFCYDLLTQAGVAVTPGKDFGDHRAAEHVRFSYTTAIENLETGVQRISQFLKTN